MFHFEVLKLIPTILQFCIIFLLFFWLWTRRHLYIFALRTPGYWGLPYFGYFLKIQDSKNFVSALHRTLEASKLNTVLVWFGLKPVLLTRDPILIEQVLTSPSLSVRPKSFTDLTTQMIGNGLVNSKGSKWHHTRKLIIPFFHQKNLLNFFPVFNNTKNKLIQIFAELETQKEHEIYSIIQEQMLDSAIATILNPESKHTLEDIKNYLQCSNSCKQELLSKMTFHFLNLKKFAQCNTKTTSYLRKFVKEIIAEHQIFKIDTENLDTYERKESKKVSNFLDFAMELYRTHKLSKEDIISEARTLLETTFDSTTNVLFSALFLVAMHPTVQQKLYEELKIVFPNKTFVVSYEDFEQLPYLNMVINETLRVFPPIPISSRETFEDTKLGEKWSLPKGLQIVMLISDLHRSTEFWGIDACKFNPDNFLPDNISKVPTNAFIPFSKGLRTCIGSRYALYSLKVLIAGLVRNFEFKTNFKFTNLRYTVTVGIDFIEKPQLEITRREE